MCALAQAEDSVTVKGKRFKFETCEEINLDGHGASVTVRSIACTWRITPCRGGVSHLRNLPPSTPSPLTLLAATAKGCRHSAAVRKPRPIQAPEDDRLGKLGVCDESMGGVGVA